MVYYNSVIQYINSFINKNFIFFIDHESYEYIKNEITLWDTCVIQILNYEELYYYQKYYNALMNVDNINCTSIDYDRTNCNERDNVMKSIIIWLSKVELFILAKEICDKKFKHIEYFVYIDAGMFRGFEFKGDRFRFIREFYENNYRINVFNDIVVNYSHESINFNKHVNSDSNFLNHGEHEVACGHLLFSKNIVNTIFDLFEKHFCILLASNIVTTEQRIMSLVFYELYSIRPNIFTFKRDNTGCTCKINFHMDDTNEENDKEEIVDTTSTENFQVYKRRHKRKYYIN